MEGVEVMAETAWSLVPPIITIILALATKEVYMSLAIGIFIGVLMFTGFSVLTAIDTMFNIMSDKIGGMLTSSYFWCCWELLWQPSRNQVLPRLTAIWQREKSKENGRHFLLR